MVFHESVYPDHGYHNHGFEESVCPLAFFFTVFTTLDFSLPKTRERWSEKKMRLNLKIICTCVQPVRLYAWYTCFSVQPRFYRERLLRSSRSNESSGTQWCNDYTPGSSRIVRGHCPPDPAAALAAVTNRAVPNGVTTIHQVRHALSAATCR